MQAYKAETTSKRQARRNIWFSILSLTVKKSENFTLSIIFGQLPSSAASSRERYSWRGYSSYWFDRFNFSVSRNFWYAPTKWGGRQIEWHNSPMSTCVRSRQDSPAAWNTSRRCRRVVRRRDQSGSCQPSAGCAHAHEYTNSNYDVHFCY